MKNLHPRIILENYYEPCVLLLLTKAPSYGYKLRDDLKKQLSCEVHIGNLYRCLQRLHTNGFVTKYQTRSEAGPDRVMYHITAEGRVLLSDWIEKLKAERTILSKLLHYSEKVMK